MTPTSASSSLQDKARDIDYARKYSRAIKYLNEIQDNADPARKARVRNNLFYFTIAVIILLIVAVVSYLKG